MQPRTSPEVGGHGALDEAQGGSALHPRQGQLRRRHRAAGHALHGHRPQPVSRTRRSSQIDTRRRSRSRACSRSSPARRWPSTTSTGCRRSCRTPRWCCPIEKVMYQAQEVAAVHRHRAATPRPTAWPRWRSTTSRCRSVVDPYKALEPGAPLAPHRQEGQEGQPHLALGGGRQGRDRHGVRRGRRHGRRRTCTSRASTSRRSRRAAASPTSTRSNGQAHGLHDHAGAARDPHGRSRWSPGTSGSPRSKIRIISPDIGGGFGGKVPVYPGYVIAIGGVGR